MNPEPVPAYLPAEDMAPIVAFEIKIPLPNPNNPHGSAIVMGLRFTVTVENNKINIEKSLFLGGNKALNNQCIVIYGNTEDEDVNVEWKLKKAS